MSFYEHSVCHIYILYFVTIQIVIYFLKDGDIERSRAFPVASAAIPYPRSVDVRRFKCIVSLVRVHLMTFRSNDVDLAQSAASPRLSASGCFRRSGSRGLRWNSLMRRREQCKKKKSMRARDPVHRHTHVTFTRVPAFLVHRFLVSSRANARPQSPSIINLKKYYLVYSLERSIGIYKF